MRGDEIPPDLERAGGRRAGVLVVNVNGERGKRWEREVVTVLRAYGYPYAERTLRGGAHADRGDIAGVPGLLIECKDAARLGGHELGRWMDEALEEAATAIACGVFAGELAPILAIRRRGKSAARAYAVLELATLARLLA